MRDSNTTIQNNEFKNARAGRISSGPVHCLGVAINNDSLSAIIRNNTFHDWQEHRTVTLTNQGHAIWAGIWADVNADSGQVLRNRFYNIDQNKKDSSNPLGSSQNSHAVLIESRCDNWLVQENVIYRIGYSGLRNGSASTGDPNYNKYINNTIYGCGVFGIEYVRGWRTTIKNNILFESGQAQIWFSSTAVSEGPHVINYNDYYDIATGGKKVGKWGSYTVLSFSGWKSQCGQDSKSKNANPLFVNPGSGNFYLSSSSPCRDAGESGVDMGAYPSGTTTSAPISLTNEDANPRLMLDGGRLFDLSPSLALGFPAIVRSTGSDRVTSSGDNTSSPSPLDDPFRDYQAIMRENPKVETPAVTRAIALDSGGLGTGEFQADNYIDGGSNASYAAAIDTSEVSHPAPEAVYQTERWGNDFTYTVRGLTAGGLYIVRLHFAENLWNSTGERKFNVSINNTMVLLDFDILASAGAPHKAVAPEFAAIANDLGQIVVHYSQGTADLPMSNGIEVKEVLPVRAVASGNSGG
jgi:parallel beta-helix repeat protein